MGLTRQIFLVQPLLLGLIACGARNQSVEVGDSKPSGGRPSAQQNSGQIDCLNNPLNPACQDPGDTTGGQQPIDSGDAGGSNAGGAWDVLLEKARSQGLNLGDMGSIVNYSETCDAGSTPPLKPITGARSDRLNSQHPDLNIWMRGMKYIGPASLKTQAGPEDPNAVRVYSFLPSGKNTKPKSSYQVFDWNWPQDQSAVDADGYKTSLGTRGGAIGGSSKEASAVGFETTKGTEVKVPKRVGQFVIENYIAIVLFASNNSITLKYTREDNVVSGYTVHISGVCVNSNIVSAFRANEKSTNRLAVREGETIGKALGSEILFMVRDVGSFMNPLDTNHWWDD